MQPIQFVYIDLGNVLVNFDHEIAARNLAKLAGCATEKMRRVIFESGLEDRYELGSISSQEFVSKINAEIESQLDVETSLEVVSNIFDPNLEMIEVLQYLKSIEMPLGLLSNTCPAHWEWIRRQRYSTVEGWFQSHILSFEVRSMKPSPTIYRIATERAATEPSGIFFTDDRPENVMAARAFGWQAELFTSASNLMDLVRGWSHRSCLGPPQQAASLSDFSPK